MSDPGWTQVEEVFHRAADLPAEARGRYLDEACAGHPALRREVESLLAHERESGSTFQAPAGTETPRSIAHYRITGKLGRGGMGTVYRAIDTKLGREVAIKVLPPHFAKDPDRLARFSREARVLASLNHPNIAAVYGVEDRAIVMEIVEGTELKGPLLLDVALDYARQIADALDAAHERGIIHRDLKPGNIKVTRAGTVKILDFGLAKTAGREVSGAAGAPAPGEETPTATGIILGTPAYMSPEQARGEETDRRADIWAFGVIVWEMITGRRLFTGDGVSDVLAAVLTEEPDLDVVPERVRPLVSACLERDPRKRLRDIGDWRRLLENEHPRRRASRAAWVAAALFGIAAGIAGLWAPWRAGPEARPLLQLDLETDGIGGPLAVSPDGTTIAFIGRIKNQVALRRLDQPRTVYLPGTESANFPFFSPNGKWIGFFSEGKLRKITVEGESLQAICDAPAGRGGAWTTDDWIVFAPAVTGGLSRVRASGGKPEAFTQVKSDPPIFNAHRWPAPLPNAGVLFTSHPYGLMTDAIRAARANGEVKTVLEAGSGARYLGGHLIFWRNNSLFAAAFDPDRLEVTGPAIPLADNVGGGPLAGPAMASGGTTVVYRHSGAATLRRIVSIGAKGQMDVLTESRGFYMQPRVSPDGRKLAFAMDREGARSVWIYDLELRTMKRLGVDSNDQDSPAWSADGAYLFFRSGSTVGWMRSDGSGSIERFKRDDAAYVPEAATPDGRFLILSRELPDGAQPMRAKIDFSGGKLALTELMEVGETNEGGYIRVSPDGRWLAYFLRTANGFEAFVRRAAQWPADSRRWPIPVRIGVYPVWAPTGERLFVRDEGGHFFSAAWSDKGDSFSLAPLHMWTERTVAGMGPLWLYDIARDGRVITLLEDPATTPDNHLRVMLNVGDELKRRAARGSGAK